MFMNGGVNDVDNKDKGWSDASGNFTCLSSSLWKTRQQLYHKSEEDTSFIKFHRWKIPFNSASSPNCAPASKKAIKILSPQFLFVSENSPPAMTQSEIFNKTCKCFSFRFLSFLACPSMATFI